MGSLSLRMWIATVGGPLLLAGGVWLTLVYYDQWEAGSVSQIGDVPYVGVSFRGLVVSGEVSYLHHRQWRGEYVLFSAKADEDDVLSFCARSGFEVWPEMGGDISFVRDVTEARGSHLPFATEFSGSDMMAKGALRAVDMVIMYYRRSDGWLTVRVFHLRRRGREGGTHR